MAKAKATSSNPPLPTSSSIQNRDLLLRLSFMHQAATFFLVAQEEESQHPVASGSGGGEEQIRRCGKGKEVEVKKGGGKKRKRRREGDEGSLSRLARGIGEGIKDISVHNKAKLDPSFKRSICKACSTILLPGTTSKIKIKPSSSHSHLIQETCLTCSLSRSIPAPPPPPAASEPAGEPATSSSVEEMGEEGMKGIEVEVEVGSSKEDEAVGLGKKNETRGKLPLFSDRAGVGHVRMVGGSKELI